MVEKNRKYLVTSALPYANGPLHIGQIAGAYLPADIYVRYLRLAGANVIYICGSDEHGVPITVVAEQEGMTPQEVADKYHFANKRAFERFGMSFDNYSRTSLREIHYPLARQFFTELNDAGYITVKESEQLYCHACKRFLPDRYVFGKCPHCGAEARGDQCDECGRWLAALELEEPKCKVCGSTPEPRKTTHWYLELPKFADWLREWLGTKTDWRDNVRRFCLGWIDEGLEDRAITRDISWGVPVPLPEANGKVLYVWFDAPIGYISSTIEWARNLGEPDRWKDYWLDPGTKMVHFIGKDNIVFHAIVWPAMLHGQTSVEYVLPDQIPANEFLNLEGRQMSTSKNWAVWLDRLLDDFPADVVRYALTSNAPETRDSDFTFRDFGSRVNDELADTFGNFINRSLGFIARYLGNKIPEAAELSPEDKKLLYYTTAQITRVGELIENFEMKNGQREVMNIARAANKYYNDEEPWARRDDDPGRCGTILNVCCRVVGALSAAMDPFTPFAAEELRRMLKIGEPLAWEDAPRYEPVPGTELGEVRILVQKIPDEEVDRQVEKLEAQSVTPEGEAGPKEEAAMVEVSFDDVTKLGLVTAKVLECDKVEGADKLLVMKIDIGGEERQIVAGIAPWYKPDELLGKIIVVVANMVPATIRGVDSRGMLLAASVGDDENVRVLTVDGEVPPGCKVT
jgi:methionyl-tRNA synthetase